VAQLLSVSGKAMAHSLITILESSHLEQDAPRLKNQVFTHAQARLQTRLSAKQCATSGTANHVFVQAKKK